MDTFTLTTPSGTQVVLRSFITGRQAEAILLEKAKEGATEFDALHVIFANVVVSVDGSAENVVERLRDLPLEDYSAVAAKAVEIADGKKNVKNTETTSNTSSTEASQASA